MRLSRKGAYERFLPWHEGAQEKTQRNDQACSIYCKRIRVADQKRKAVSQEKYYNRYYRPKKPAPSQECQCRALTDDEKRNGRFFRGSSKLEQIRTNEPEQKEQSSSEVPAW
ncbi:hypothetical protein [Gluconobacter oxydans]|uniref:hypothetical protein n=1 Tax=Gluconobacter oxydans TaxID=442 RepID=UPI003464C0E9